MCQNLFLTLSLLLVTCLLAQIPISSCQDHDEFESCGKLIQCGNLQLGYPFYGAGREHHCGYFGFEITCENGVPLINMLSVRYRVLAVNDTTQTLRFARDDLWNDLCPVNLYDTTLDFYIFDYGSNYQNISLYHGCSLIPGRVSRLPNQFNCSVNSTASFGFYLTGDAPFSNYANAVKCKNHIVVPVNQAAFPSIADLNSRADNLRRALADGFELQWFARDADCNQCTQSGGRCGHDSVTGLFSCYCPNGPYGLTCPSSQPASDKRVRQRIIISIALSVVGAIIIFSITALYFRRRRYSLLPSDQNIEVFMKNWGSVAPKEYNYSEITKITNSFREKLGQGGYGSVYKGKLPDGRLVAVKVLNETKGSGEEFINEVSSISRTSHVNIVNLLGFCYNRKRALIYEFMPNGSLDKFINKHGSPDADYLLEWKTLYQIAVSIARGLEYLHRGCNTRIVHFDIKPHNILLDEDFCPKISDFGLAKLYEKKESILSLLTARGTAGYIAPEVLSRQFGGVSHKSDVYSFGMMVLEMVGVRKNVVEMERSSEVYFPQWIYEHLELGKELNIQNITGEEEEEMSRKMILVGLWCIQTNPSDRPSISKVVEMLEGSLDSLQVPPKPYFDAPQRRLPNNSSTSFSS